MELSWLRYPKVLVGVLVGLLVLVVGFFVLRGDEGDTEVAVEPTLEEPKTTDPCELWTSEELQEWLGGNPWEEDEELSTGPTCVYREVDGPGSVSVLLNEAPDQVLFDALRSYRAMSPLDGVGDEAWWWEDPSLPGGGVVMRVGGRAATIDLGGQFDDRLARAAVGVPQFSEGGAEDDGGDDTEREEDLIPALSAQEISVEIHRRLTALGSAVGSRLEPLPFAQGVTDESASGPVSGTVTVGEAICAALSVDAMSADMQVSTEGAALTAMGERGCTFSNADGVNVTVELVADGADESVLEVGREMTIEGETLVWEPEPVEGLGDGAVWMVDPTSGTTGELNALFDRAFVRVSSSGPEAEGLKERAVAAARLAGVDLVDVDLGERGD